MESKHLKAHNEQTRKQNNEYGLWTALHKYQSLGLKAKATGVNPHYDSKYSTLEDCIECANKGIEFGLFFTQHCDNIDGHTCLRTVIRHINDTETTSMIYPITCKDINNPQQIKSSSCQHFTRRLKLSGKSWKNIQTMSIGLKNWSSFMRL